MFKRWFIRCLFMLPIVLCIGGWGWSYAYDFEAFVPVRGNQFWCGAGSGSVYFGMNLAGSAGLMPNRWSCDVLEHFAGRFSANHGSYLCSFLGFVLWRDPPDYMLGVPFWFFFIVSSAVFFFVWRKTRKSKPERAFPVEIKSQGA